MRVRGVWLSVLLIMTVLLAACSSAKPSSSPAPAAPSGSGAPASTPTPAPAPLQPINVDMVVSSTTSMVNFPVFVAQAAGLFEKNGVIVKFINGGSGTKAAAAVLSGSVGIATTGGSYTIEAADKGQALRFVLPVLNQLTVSLVLNNKTYQERGIKPGMSAQEIMTKLKGIKIGTSTAGSSSDQFARFLIGQAGMNVDNDFKLLPLGGNVSDIIAAFDRNQVDAVTYSTPVPEQIESDGTGKMVISLLRGDVPNVAGAYYVGILASDKFIKENPEAVQRIVNAVAEAQLMIKNDKEKARAAGAKFLDKMDPKVYNAAFDNIANAIPSQIKPMEQKGFDSLILYNSLTEGTKYDVKFDQLATNQFIDKYLKK